MALTYHAGQIEVQTEANSRPAADMLAVRTAGRSERILGFYAAADLVVMAAADEAGRLCFNAFSGTAPLLKPLDEATLALPGDASPLAEGTQVGAIAINLEQGRRARANGRVVLRDGGPALVAAEELVNCRKYIAPSIALEDGLHCGPSTREAVEPGEPGVAAVISRLETAFLASVNPAGQPDVSHKGGPAGFVDFDAATRRLSWPELIGNGMFKSAGNVRATGTVSLLALDLASGDAYEFSGRGEYRTELRHEQPRESGLWPSEFDFPTQGVMTVQVEQITLLRGLILPRQRLESQAKITGLLASRGAGTEIAVSRQPSAVSRQPSAVSRQPSAVSRQRRFCMGSWPAPRPEGRGLACVSGCAVGGASPSP